MSSVLTMANPENIAPATKYGGNIVVCHPGMTDVAKSNDTMVCTESTSGVARPASTRDTSSKRCQSLGRIRDLYLSVSFSCILVDRSIA